MFGVIVMPRNDDADMLTTQHGINAERIMEIEIDTPDAIQI
jgi:hypothetical protein